MLEFIKELKRLLVNYINKERWPDDTNGRWPGSITASNIDKNNSSVRSPFSSSYSEKDFSEDTSLERFPCVDTPPIVRTPNEETINQFEKTNGKLKYVPQNIVSADFKTFSNKEGRPILVITSRDEITIFLDSANYYNFYPKENSCIHNIDNGLDSCICMNLSNSLMIKRIASNLPDGSSFFAMLKEHTPANDGLLMGISSSSKTLMPLSLEMRTPSKSSIKFLYPDITSNKTLPDKISIFANDLDYSLPRNSDGTYSGNNFKFENISTNFAKEYGSVALTESFVYKTIMSENFPYLPEEIVNIITTLRGKEQPDSMR